MDRQESSQVLGFGPSSASLSHPPAINQLPQELIIVIFHLSLDPWITVKARTRLVLVCRYWKAIVEGTPSFWTLINAADGLQHALKAVTKTEESPIDFILGIHDPVSVGEFLAAVSEKVERWRSVNLTFRGAFPASFGSLQTSTFQSLEKLRLGWDELNLEASTLTLFDGGPAPETLKDVWFCGIPVNLAPMRLSKLSSLVLIVPAFTPTLKRLLSTAKHIKLEFGDEEFSIAFGGLKIDLLDAAGAEGFQYVREMLDSLMDHSGEKGKELKVHLQFSGVNPTIAEVQIFNSCLMVEQVTLSEGFWSNSIPIKTIDALGTPIPASSHR
ncbi:hypothetical protein FS837_006523 [Tulasnella sp. UAMH 9824]|nr:hypothetical protein FS837_006523 [Tulasnella sp. UAMH 9824]